LGAPTQGKECNQPLAAGVHRNSLAVYLQAESVKQTQAPEMLTRLHRRHLL